MTYPKSLCDIIIAATEQELHSLEVEAVYDSKHRLKLPDKSKVAMLLFLGHEISGIFSICCDAKVLAQTFPLEAKIAHQSHLDDWLQELTNTLIGRIRAEFTEYGIEIDISIPKLHKYRQLKEAEITLTPFQTFTFKSKFGKLHAFFAADISQSVDLTGPKAPDSVIGPSGSAHVF